MCLSVATVPNKSLKCFPLLRTETRADKSKIKNKYIKLFSYEES